MLIFDSHAHYFDDRFLSDEEGPTAEQLLPNILAPTGIVSHIINVGTNIQSSRHALMQAARYPGMYAAVGIHPEDCQQIEQPEEQMRALRELLYADDPNGCALRRERKIVAIGEIGLDYYERDYLPVDKTLQAWYFEQQLILAEELDLPVIIHDREAHGDCFETVLRHPGVRGVFHSFSGSAEMAHDLTRRGWYISFSGVVTFKNASRVRQVAAGVPLDRLLVETDAPYLAPHPHRGKRNESSYIPIIGNFIAELTEHPIEQVAQITTNNAKSLFKI